MLLLSVIPAIAGCAGKAAPNTVGAPEDMMGKTIGYVTGTPAAVYAEGYGTLQAYQSAETMLVDLKNGALDCAVMEESAAKSAIRKVSGLKILKQPLVKDDLHFAIAKENPDLTKVVNEALKTLNDSGVLGKIIDGYKTADGYRYKTPAGTELSAGTLTLAVIGGFPPYSYDDGKGNAVGIDVDIARGRLRPPPRADGNYPHRQEQPCHDGAVRKGRPGAGRSHRYRGERPAGGLLCSVFEDDAGHHRPPLSAKTM